MSIDKLATMSNGRFLTIKFIKQDGTIRTINGRFGVKCHLKGGKATIDGSKYLTIYSVKDKGYRSINRSTILSVNMDNVHIVCKGN